MYSVTINHQGNCATEFQSFNRKFDTVEAAEAYYSTLTASSDLSDKAVSLALKNEQTKTTLKEHRFQA